MKKLLSVLLISLFTAAFIFAETSQIEEESDYYEDSETVENKKKKEGNENAPFFNFSSSSSQKFITGDEISIYALNTLNKIKAKNAVITYNTKKETIGFGSTYLAAYYIVTMDEKNRNILKSAYESYLKDFSNKKLKRDSNKTKYAYGKIKLNLDWGTIKASTPNNGVAEGYLGYCFYNKSPYFTLQIIPAFNEYSKDSESATRESITLSYAFTKAQMQTLLEKTSSEEISKIIYSLSEPVEYIDDYNESEETITEPAEEAAPAVETDEKSTDDTTTSEEQ